MIQKEEEREIKGISLNFVYKFLEIHLFAKRSNNF